MPRGGIFSRLLNTTTRPWTRLLRILVTILLLGLVLWVTPLQSTATAIRDANVYWLAASLSLFLAATWVQALRWKILLDERSIPLSLLIRIQLIGTAAGFFLPSSLAGDMARTTLLSRSEGLLEKSILSTIASRLLGLAALMFLALAGAMFWGGQSLQLKPGKSVLALASLALVSIGPAWYAWKVLRRNSAWWNRGPAWKQRIYNGFAYIDRSLRNPRILGQSLILSVVLQGLTLSAGWCLFMAARASIGIGTVFALLPLVQLGSLAPLSVGGLGIREGLTMALFHGIAGIPRSTCLAVMTLGFSTSVVLCLPGIVLFYPTWRQKRRSTPPTPALTEAEDA